jgi:hypothetical protein
MLHVYLGPLAGLPFAVVVVVIYAWALSGRAASIGPSDLLTMASALFMSALVPAIFVGIVPSVAHALIMLGLSIILSSRAMWVAMTPLVGASVGGLCALGLQHLGARNLAEPAVILMAASSGAAVCVLVGVWKGGALPPMRGEA